jgi:hypothetical protein
MMTRRVMSTAGSAPDVDCGPAFRKYVDLVNGSQDGFASTCQQSVDRPPIRRSSDPASLCAMVSPLESSSAPSGPPGEAAHVAPARRPSRRLVVAPAPSAEHALAARADEVLRARVGCAPARWLLPGFAADVDQVRRQLGPLRDRQMLAASFERESARLAALRRLAADPAIAPLPVGPLEAAYAIRWLELADGGMALPPWRTFIEGGVTGPDAVDPSPG